MASFGDHFAYVGGSFELTEGSLTKAIRITEKELERTQGRLTLFLNNPEHISFAHDMKWHGEGTILMLLRSRIKASSNQLRDLKAIGGYQLSLL